jgi:sphingomyelin phosphodiesterase 2
VVVCGNFNIDRESGLFSDFVSQTRLGDAFDGRCPPTFRAEYLSAALWVNASQAGNGL